MDGMNLPPTTMPMIIPTSEDFLGVEVGVGGPDGVVAIVPVGVGVPVDSGAAGGVLVGGGGWVGVRTYMCPLRLR